MIGVLSDAALTVLQCNLTDVRGHVAVFVFEWMNKIGNGERGSCSNINPEFSGYT